MTADEKPVGTGGKVKRALERLRPDESVAIEKAGVFVELGEEDESGLLEFHADLRKPLAALIEDLAQFAEDSETCAICMADSESDATGRHLEHKPDCALIQLVDAINGDSP